MDWLLATLEVDDFGVKAERRVRCTKENVHRKKILCQQSPAKWASYSLGRKFAKTTQKGVGRTAAGWCDEIWSGSILP